MSRRPWLTAFTVLTLLALTTTWPLAAHLPNRVPLGTERVATVPHASAWALDWVAHSASRAGLGLWDAPIFHPTQRTFALSEPLLVQGLLVAPARWLGGSASLLLNVAVLLTLVANGLAAFGLLGHLRARLGERLVGASLVVVAPYVSDQLGVLALTAMAGPIATIWALLEVADRPDARRGLGLGLAFSITYLSCAQYGLFVALCLTPAALWVLWRTRRAGLRALAVALLPCLLLVGPVVHAQLSTRDALGLGRSSTLVADHAARLSDFALSSEALRHPWLEIARGAKHALHPGAAIMVLAGVAVGVAVAGRRRPRRNAAVGVIVSFGVVAQLLAMYPHLPGGDVLRTIPGLAQIRSVWRAAGLWQVSVALLAGIGLLSGRTAASSLGDGRLRRAARALPMLLALAAVVEVWPRPQPLAATPRAGQYAELGAYLRAHTAEGEPLLFLPAPETGRVSDYGPWAWWMAAQSQIGRRMVGGYSSYFPRQPYRDVLADLRAHGERDDWWRSSAQLGVRLVVTDAAWWAEHGSVDLPVRWRSPDGGLLVVALPRTQ